MEISIHRAKPRHSLHLAFVSSPQLKRKVGQISDENAPNHHEPRFLSKIKAFSLENLHITYLEVLKTYGNAILWGKKSVKFRTKLPPPPLEHHPRLLKDKLNPQLNKSFNIYLFCLLKESLVLVVYSCLSSIP